MLMLRLHNRSFDAPVTSSLHVTYFIHLVHSLTLELNLSAQDKCNLPLPLNLCLFSLRQSSRTHARTQLRGFLQAGVTLCGQERQTHGVLMVLEVRWVTTQAAPW